MAPHPVTPEHPAWPEDHSSAPREGVGARPFLPKPRGSGAGWNLLLVLLMFFLAVAGCKDPNSMERTRQRADAAGKSDGKNAGDADGFKSTYETSKDDAYDAKVRELYDSNNFMRQRSYTLIVLGVAFLLGFSLQYAALYLLRRNELLFDIDRIVLPRHETQVNLTRLLDAPVLEDTSAPKKLKAASSDASHDR